MALQACDLKEDRHAGEPIAAPPALAPGDARLTFEAQGPRSAASFP